jgi:hypothetical protein
MDLNIIWKRNISSVESIIGICPILPDTFCNFHIMRLASDKFWVALPGISTDFLSKRLILRDAQIARQFCLDYLNHNTKSIVEHQISEMKRRSSPSIKSRTYYETFLESRLGRQPEIPPKRPFRKAS